MLLGTYEQACVPWSPRETPWDFGHELLKPDLDRIAPELEVGFQHFPALETAGIKQVVNGPFTFAPDGNPLVGPVRGLRDFWVACGVMAGLRQGGGVGLALANWMIDGRPRRSTSGAWTSPASATGRRCAYTNAKVRENYSRRFRIRFPNEELPAGAAAADDADLRPARPRQNAVLGATFGLEHAALVRGRRRRAGEDVDASAARTPSRRSREECRAVRERVGLTEISNYAKYGVTGPGPRTWLDRILTNRLPQHGPHHARRRCSTRTAGSSASSRSRGSRDERFFVFGSRLAEAYHMRWFERLLPDGAGDPGLRHGPRRAVDRRTPVARGPGGGRARPMSRTPPSRSWPSAAWTSGSCRRSSAGSATPAISATRSGSSRSTSARCTGPSSTPARRSACDSSACGRCIRCGLRRATAPGRASTARSTPRPRPASTASSR